MKKIEIGIIGCGAMGTEMARYIETHFQVKASLVAVCDVVPEKAEQLAKALQNKPKILSLSDLIQEVDFVIEAAFTSVIPELMECVIKHNKKVLLMSIGGLLGQERLLKKAEEKGIEIFIPSGAVGGLEEGFGQVGIHAAHVDGIGRAGIALEVASSG